MRAEIEDIPFESRGIEVTSESEEERQHLETMWSRSAAAVMLTRNDNGNVTLTIGPTKPEGGISYFRRAGGAGKAC